MRSSRPWNFEHIGGFKIERVGQECFDLGRGVGFDFQPHGNASPPLADLFLDRLEQVFHFIVVDLILAVAADPEDGRAFQLQAGKKLGQIEADDRLQGREDVAAFGRQCDKTR